jgi:hypothetical protein
MATKAILQTFQSLCVRSALFTSFHYSSKHHTIRIRTNIWISLPDSTLSSTFQNSTVSISIHYSSTFTSFA